MTVAGVVLVLVVAGAFVVHRYVGTTSYYMPAASMEPFIMAGEHFEAERVDEYVPRRGDVLVFEDGAGWLGPMATDGQLVKRVIGVPGDTIVCCDDEGRLSINGEPLDESAYIDMSRFPCAGPMIPSCDWSAGPVPADRLFVLGDNRDDSADSSFMLCRSESTARDPDLAYVSVESVLAIATK